MRPRVAARLEGLGQSDRLRGGVAEASSRSLSRSLTPIRWGGRWPLCRRASRGPTGAPRRPIGGHHPACSTCFGLNFSVLLVAARCGINPWGRDTHSARHPRSVPVTPPRTGGRAAPLPLQQPRRVPTLCCCPSSGCPQQHSCGHSLWGRCSDHPCSCSCREGGTRLGVHVIAAAVARPSARGEWGWPPCVKRRGRS